MGDLVDGNEARVRFGRLDGLGLTRAHNADAYRYPPAFESIHNVNLTLSFFGKNLIMTTTTESPTETGLMLPQLKLCHNDNPATTLVGKPQPLWVVILGKHQVLT